MGYRLNGCDTDGVPVYLIKRLLEHTAIPVFVETGTAAGGSIKQAAELFEKCYTCKTK